MGLTTRDALGVLGRTSTSRLARVTLHGDLSDLQQVYIPDHSLMTGAIVKWFPDRFHGWAGYEFNDTTKILTAQGNCRYLVLDFAGARRAISGFYGLTILNSNNEVVIDNRNRNLEVVASGTANIATGQAPFYINYPQVDAPLVFIQMPTDVWIYVGTVGATQAIVSSQDPATFNYFVAGFRVNTAGVPSGMVGLSMKDAAGRTIFASSRAYARIPGSYWSSYPNVAWSGNKDDATFQMQPAPAGSYTCIGTCSSKPDTIDTDFGFPVAKATSGGYDYFRIMRRPIAPSKRQTLGLSYYSAADARTQLYSLVGALS